MLLALVRERAKDVPMLRGIPAFKSLWVGLFKSPRATNQGAGFLVARGWGPVGYPCGLESFGRQYRIPVMPSYADAGAGAMIAREQGTLGVTLL